MTNPSRCHECGKTIYAESDKCTQCRLDAADAARVAHGPEPEAATTRPDARGTVSDDLVDRGERSRSKSYNRRLADGFRMLNGDSPW